MIEKLNELKEILIDLGASIKATIEVNILIEKIERDSITIEKLASSLSKYEKDFREELLEAYENNEIVYEPLKRANEFLERKRKEEFINSVKTNIYKEYLNTLLPVQIYDLRESLVKDAKVIALYNINKYNEYVTYIEILEEMISIIAGEEIIDFSGLEDKFKTLTTEEIASYIKTYPMTMLFVETKDKELASKLLDAIEMVKTKDVKKLEEDVLIYKKRKYF